MVEWEFPEKLGFLFQPSRYKVAYGGRDAGKSWSFARALLLQAAEKPLRIGCFREVQEHPRLGPGCYPTKSSRWVCRMLMRFFGQRFAARMAANSCLPDCQNQTRDSIKSAEGLDIAWIEEAQSVSKRSWDIDSDLTQKPAPRYGLVSTGP